MGNLASTALALDAAAAPPGRRRRPPSSQTERERRKAFGAKYGNIMREIKRERERSTE